MADAKTPSTPPILAWKAPQHPAVTRGKTWYTIMALVAIGLLIYSILSAAWTFTAVIIILSGLYWNSHRAEPTEKTIRIWERGFAIEDNFHLWSTCKGYWIMRGERTAELHIEKQHGSEVKILIGNMDPYRLHEILSPLTTELTDRREHILDTIIRICKL